MVIRRSFVKNFVSFPKQSIIYPSFILPSSIRVHSYHSSFRFNDEPNFDSIKNAGQKKKSKKPWLTPNQEWAIGILAFAWIIFSVLNWEYRWVGECPVTSNDNSILSNLQSKQEEL
mmetsp:Transcript_8492/g.12532  ORF Transcript_8492/g.12532 Transcript_8492/m.12532 type:complete len:116 (+) Transcript_8492:56-403(+)